MKLKTLSPGSFTFDQPLRAAGARYHAAEEKIQKAQADAVSRRAERQRIISTQAEAETVNMDLVRKAGEMEIMAGIGDTTAAQISATLPALEQEKDYQQECGKRLLANARRQIETVVKGNIDKAISPFVADCEARESLVFEIYRDSVQASDFYANTSAGRYSQSVEAAAEQVLESFEKFKAGLKKHAELLGADFNPFPTTEAEYLALCPARTIREVAAIATK